MKNQTAMFVSMIATVLKVKRSVAALIESYLNEDEFTLRRHPKLKTYLSRCYCYPARYELALELAGVLSGHDVQGCQLESGDYVIYLNKGDVYDKTLLWDGRMEEFNVDSVGNILESDLENSDLENEGEYNA